MSVQCLFVVSVELSWLHHDECEQGCDNSRATPVSVNGVWVPIALQLADIVRD